MTVNLDSISEADLDRELRRRRREQAIAKHRADFPVQGPMFGPTRDDYKRVLVERRMSVRRKQLRAQAIAAAERVAVWDVPAFSAVATGDAEHDGRSRQDDIDKLTAIEFAATLYPQGITGPTGKASLKLVACQALNASRMIGEADANGDWQPTTHTETRRDGSTFKRYVTEQMNQVGDMHQLDGGDRIIVAVQVGWQHETPVDLGDECPPAHPVYHVIHATKRWLDMSQASAVSMFGKVYPNRNIPRKGRRFFYEPVAYIRCTSADDAAELAWRWASEDRLTDDDSTQHAAPSDIGPDFLRPNRPSRALQQARAKANG
mgnify:CR=1 FL=1